MTEPMVDGDFEALLVWLRDTHSSDFTGYKRPSLQRLVERRMSAAGVTGYRVYLDLLQVEAAEVRALLDALLINVTAMFRDADTWAVLRDSLVPEAIARLGADEPIRVWCAACATGEEAYTLAMVLHEVLGEAEFLRRVKVYATDIDESALAVARAGRYTAPELEVLTPEQRGAFFDPDGDRFRFKAHLRQSIIFGRHDLLQDAPISRVLLLSCRNALMYFTAETQTRVLERFSFALHPAGLLVLGKAEMLLTQSALFTPLDLPRRVFTARRGSPASRLSALVLGGYGNRDITRLRVTEAAFTGAPAAQVVLDATGCVVLLSDRAQRHLPLSQADLGKPFADLDIAQRPIELVGHVAEVSTRRSAITIREVRYPQGETTWDLTIAPLEVEGELLGVHLVFLDVTERDALEQRLSQQAAELGSAYEELQSSTEELEATNEELQSAVEELETTNEELQSTNEELETMNEELQSTNEELQTLNDELRERTNDADRSNTFMVAILESLDSAVVIVDADGRVLLWNTGAEAMTGLRSFEVAGQDVLALELGLPAPRVRQVLMGVLRGPQARGEDVVAVLDRTGHPRRRRLVVQQITGPGNALPGGGAVLTLVDESSADGTT